MDAVRAASGGAPAPECFRRRLTSSRRRRIQCCDCARLAFEAREAIRKLSCFGGEHLDRDISSEPCVAGAIHFSHAAGATRADDFAWAEPRSAR
jgi:hypothetical protein